MPDSLQEFLTHRWFGISGMQWLVASLIVVALTPLLVLVRNLIAGRLRKLAARSKTDFDDFLVSLVERTRGWFLAVFSLRVASLVLDLPARWDARLQSLLVVAGMLQGGVWAGALIRYIVDLRFARHVHGGVAPAPGVTPVAQTLLRFAGLVVVWTIVLLAVLSAFGVDITALVAGLGVGGVAVALAVQKVLGDVLASISIAVDKPFVPGDFIAVDDKMGTVQKIGIRSTSIAALSGEGLVLANNDLLGARIQNFTRMVERRVVFKVGVVYDTPQPLLEKLPQILRECVDGREKLRFDRGALVNLGESAIEYEVVYIVTDPDYNVFVALHQAILLDLIRRMRAEGYDFAFPTRTIEISPPEGVPLAGAAPAPAPTPTST